MDVSPSHRRRPPGATSSLSTLPQAAYRALAMRRLASISIALGLAACGPTVAKAPVAASPDRSRAHLGAAHVSAARASFETRYARRLTAPDAGALRWDDEGEHSTSGGADLRGARPERALGARGQCAGEPAARRDHPPSRGDLGRLERTKWLYRPGRKKRRSALERKGSQAGGRPGRVRGRPCAARARARDKHLHLEARAPSAAHRNRGRERRHRRNGLRRRARPVRRERDARALGLRSPSGRPRRARGGDDASSLATRGIGSFRRVYAGEGPARSEELGAWLVVTDVGQRLRLADDAEGVSCWPTEAEAERAAKETEHAARATAEAEVDRLREEIAQLRANMR